MASRSVCAIGCSLCWAHARVKHVVVPFGAPSSLDSTFTMSESNRFPQSLGACILLWIEVGRGKQSKSIK